MRPARRWVITREDTALFDLVGQPRRMCATRTFREKVYLTDLRRHTDDYAPVHTLAFHVDPEKDSAVEVGSE